MANHMKEVADILGVELNEEFEIDGCSCSCIYILRETGLYEKDIMSYSCNATLNELLIGQCTIKRKPWKPIYDDIYWVTDGYCVYDKCWECSTADWNAYKIGNCYKTQKEAEENKNKWLAFYSSNEVLEV